nr:uncharacterized protein LOC112922071 [Vulpes vulpes]
MGLLPVEAEPEEERSEANNKMSGEYKELELYRKRFKDLEKLEGPFRLRTRFCPLGKELMILVSPPTPGTRKVDKDGDREAFSQKAFPQTSKTVPRIPFPSSKNAWNSVAFIQHKDLQLGFACVPYGRALQPRIRTTPSLVTGRLCGAGGQIEAAQVAVARGPLRALGRAGFASPVAETRRGPDRPPPPACNSPAPPSPQGTSSCPRHRCQGRPRQQKPEALLKSSTESERAPIPWGRRRQARNLLEGHIKEELKNRCKEGQVPKKLAEQPQRHVDSLLRCCLWLTYLQMLPAPMCFCSRFKFLFFLMKI